jgi:hypothetical protein
MNTINLKVTEVELILLNEMLTELIVLQLKIIISRLNWPTLS